MWVWQPLALIALMTVWLSALQGCTAGRPGSWQVGDCSPCVCRLLPRSRALPHYRVKHVNCSSRGLTLIPAGLPDNLEELDLSGNQVDLQNSYHNLWRYNSTKVLYLNHTNLINLPGEVFKPLGRLQYLDITGNHLMNLPGQVFSHTILLTHVTGLKVTQVPPDLFRGLSKLRSLQLTLTGDAVDEDAFRHLSLRELKLHVTGATRLPGGLLRRMGNTLLEVDISGERLTYLPGDIFSEVDLRVLKMHLPNVDSLPQNLMQASGRSVSHINHIEIEGVQSLHEDLFKHLPNLETLKLNHIGLIPPALFGDMLRLDSLDLSNNDLVKIDPTWFNILGVGLKILNLSHNRLTRIDVADLRKLESVEELDLSNNEIDFVHEESFQSFRNSIKKIHLSENKICTLDGDTFSNLWHLQTLNIDNNCLSNMHQELFRDLVELKELYLQENALKVLPSNVFSSLGMSEKLNISSTQLHMIPENSLSSMQFLKVLDISNNQLGVLPSRLIPASSELKEVYMEQNPLHCDCGVVLFIVLHKLRLTDKLTGTCSSPPPLAATPLHQLDVNQVCKNKAVKQKIEKELPSELNEEAMQYLEEEPMGSNIITTASIPVVAPSPPASRRTPVSSTTSSPGRMPSTETGSVFDVLVAIFTSIFGTSEETESPPGGSPQAEGKGGTVPGEVTSTFVVTVTVIALAFLVGAGLLIYRIYYKRKYGRSYTVNRL